MTSNVCRWCGRRNNVRCPQKEKSEIKALIWIKTLIVMNRRVRKLLQILALNLTIRQQWWTPHSWWVELSEFEAASGFKTLSRCWEFWAVSLPGFWGGVVTWIGGPFPVGVVVTEPWGGGGMLSGGVRDISSSVTRTLKTYKTWNLQPHHLVLTLPIRRRQWSTRATRLYVRASHIINQNLIF